MEGEMPEGEKQEEGILRVLRDNGGGPLSPKEVAEKLGASHDSIRQTMFQMERAKKLERPLRGAYSIPGTPTGLPAEVRDLIDEHFEGDLSNFVEWTRAQKRRPAPSERAGRVGFRIDTEEHHGEDSMKPGETPSPAGEVGHTRPFLRLEFLGEEVYRLDITGHGRDEYIVLPIKKSEPNEPEGP